MVARSDWGGDGRTDKEKRLCAYYVVGEKAAKDKDGKVRLVSHFGTHTDRCLIAVYAVIIGFHRS